MSSKHGHDKHGRKTHAGKPGAGGPIGMVKQRQGLATFLALGIIVFVALAIAGVIAYLIFN